MASLTQCTWVWVDSWSWWWTGKPGVLQFMGSQRVRRNWVTELNWRAHRSFAKPTYYNQFLEIFILWPVFLIKQRKKVLSRWLLCLLTSLTAFWTLLQFLTWKKWQLFFLNDILVLFFFFPLCNPLQCLQPTARGQAMVRGRIYSGMGHYERPRGTSLP